MANPTFDLVVLFLCLFLKTYFSLPANTISANQSLSGLMSIVSEGGAFQLGFFNRHGDRDYYLGIWLPMDVSRKVVWVANREKPISFYSHLTISDGNLVLIDESNRTVWSTNAIHSATTPRHVQAILLDTGNLVLNEVGSNSSEPLWQSFDHPTDTFLPGAKLGYNKITNTSQVITSWKNVNDPAPGLFSLQIDPSGKSFNIQWNRSKTYWSSGVWNGTTFSLVPEMSHIYLFNFVSNENETYYTYSVYNNSSTEITRVVMEFSGQIMKLNLLQPSGQLILFWSQPRKQCEVYALCGAYSSCDERYLPFCHCLTGFEPKSQTEWDLADYSGGCIRNTKLQYCGDIIRDNGERDGFREIPSMSLPEDRQHVSKNANPDV